MFRAFAICLLVAILLFSCDETNYQLLDSNGKPVDLDYNPAVQDTTETNEEEEFEF